jgi:hypothetical protein
LEKASVSTAPLNEDKQHSIRMSGVRAPGRLGFTNPASSPIKSSGNYFNGENEEADALSLVEGASPWQI